MDESRRSNRMLREVAEWLASRLGLAAEEMPRPGAWSQSGNAIGAIALRVDALSLEQIDQILVRQEAHRELFGQLAIQLDFLTPSQVERLLELQRFHRCLELAEILVMEERADLATCLGHLADYLRAQRSRSGDQEVERGRR